MTRTAASAICNFRPACFYSPRSATQRAAVAVSACLAGETVRYDGSAKLIPVHSLLNSELNLVAVCPELGAGLGVPRPPIRLVESNDELRALGRENTALDVTAGLQNFAAQSLPQLMNQYQLCGYLWKSRSPSCGFNSTPVFNTQGIEIYRGSGIQAAYFQRHLSHLNHCEETELHTENAVGSFVLRCRLVFDILHASNTPLPVLHRHYTFLHENFDTDTIENLHALNAAKRKSDYLAAFLMGCRQVPEDKLLGLFIE